MPSPVSVVCRMKIPSLANFDNHTIRAANAMGVQMCKNKLNLELLKRLLELILNTAYLSRITVGAREPRHNQKTPHNFYFIAQI